MKLGGPAVIDALNEILTAELTAINQYFVHGEMCENWGYERLQKEIRKHSIDEMKHADELVKRVLFLEGLPNLQDLGKLRIGESVEEMLRCDLLLEMDAIPDLKVAIAYAESVRAQRQLATRRAA